MDILGLRRANCKSCHKCIRVCPVKSIEFSGQQAKIIGSECILCGQCVVTCPQNAKVVRSDLPRVKQAMAEGRRVVASLAPSFIVDFPVDGVEEMAGMLEKLGFAATAETARWNAPSSRRSRPSSSMVIYTPSGLPRAWAASGLATVTALTAKPSRSRSSARTPGWAAPPASSCQS